MTIFWDADEEDDGEVVRLLKTLPGWDWSAPAYYGVTPPPVFTKVGPFLEEFVQVTPCLHLIFKL